MGRTDGHYTRTWLVMIRKQNLNHITVKISAPLNFGLLEAYLFLALPRAVQYCPFSKIYSQLFRKFTGSELHGFFNPWKLKIIKGTRGEFTSVG